VSIMSMLTRSDDRVVTREIVESKKRRDVPEISSHIGILWYACEMMQTWDGKTAGLDSRVYFKIFLPS
jgi:hypothetical protein